LKKIYNDDHNLAIIQRVGMDNLIPSHSLAELSVAYGNPSATSGPQSGFLQRLATSSGLRNFDLLDLSGGHATTTAGGNFKPLALYQLLQLVSYDYYADSLLYTRESGFRRDLYFEMMHQPGSHPNAEVDQAQGVLDVIGSDNPALRDAGTNATTLLPHYYDYQGNTAGLLFRDAELAIRYSRANKTQMSQGAGIIFGMLEGGWDSHTTQQQSMQGATQALNAAITTFRTNTQEDGLWDKCVILVYTDMGRSVAENFQRGTDHQGIGGSNAMLLMEAGCWAATTVLLPIRRNFPINQVRSPGI